MAKNEHEGKLLRTASVYPPDRSRDDRLTDFRSHAETGQRLERDNRAKEVVVHNLPDMRPKQILEISDWHFGSSVSDYDAMDELRDYVLSNPDVMVVFAGDEIEGWSGGKHSQSIDAKTDFDAQEQIEFFRVLYFEPLAKAGRILGMVSEYWAHPGWLADKTLNAWKSMIGNLDIKLIQNGGLLVARFPNKYEHVLKVWHNPPGASKYDELSGQRMVMLNTSESRRPDGSMAGHIHRMQVAEEVYAGAKRKVYYVSGGALKGTNPDLATDLFGTQLGLGRPDPAGEGVSVFPKKGRREAMNIPFASLRHASVTREAYNLFDRIEQQGMKGELLETIKNRLESQPVITYIPQRSRLGYRYQENKPLQKLKIGKETVTNHYSNMELKVPYSTLHLDIQTELPVVMNLLGNVRYGSSLEGYKEAQDWVKAISEDPHQLILFLRNMMDKNSGSLRNRMEPLDKFKDLILTAKKGQTLAVLMCESLRMKDWMNKKHDQLPIAPASYIATETDTALVHHLSYLNLAIGPGSGRKTLYPVAVADKAGNYGSSSKPEWGLQRLYDLELHEKPAAVVGTHLANAGAATFYDASNAFTRYPVLVANGWFAPVDTRGKGNVGVGAEPGQAIIFMPGNSQEENLMFPTVSREETDYMFNSLRFLMGLEKLGIKDQVLGIKKKG